MTQTFKLPIEQVKVGSRFRKDMGDVSALAKSIEELGLLQPIVVSEAKELIAGERRLQACRSLGWAEIPATVVNLQDIVKGEFAENAFRKEFTASEMIAIKRAVEPIEHEQARERQLAGTPSEESAAGRTSEHIASSLGISRDTLSKVETIVEAAEKEPEKYGDLLDKVDRKELSINKAYQEIKPRKSRESKDVIFLPEYLYCDMLNAIDEATEKGKKSLRIVHDGHSVTTIGEVAIEVSVS